jgi:phytoene dehydrogenase-like protein
MTDRAIVVGGGLAGLVAARHLAEAGVETELFEARDRLGGRVHSRTEDGYVFDRGFQVLFSSYPAVQRELDLSALDLRTFTPGATIARPGSRSTLSDPLRAPREALATVTNDEVRFADKLRVFRLQRRLANRSYENVLDGEDRSIRAYLAERGFSERFVERFAAPFYGGITLDRSLSTSSVVFEYTFKALAAGRIGVPAAGMGAIPAQLADRARAAGATLHTGSPVEGVEPDGDGVVVGVDGETRSADAAVVATDPATAGELTGVDTPTGERGCVTQYFRLPGGELDTGRKLLLNAVDDRPNQVVPLSAVNPAYAPEGETLLSAVFLGEQRENDESLADEVRRALADWYPERRFEGLELLHTDRVRFAQFEQPPGFRSELPAATAPEGPVYLAGDYTRWSSINAAMESGRTAALAV